MANASASSPGDAAPAQPALAADAHAGVHNTPPTEQSVWANFAGQTWIGAPGPGADRQASGGHKGPFCYADTKGKSADATLPPLTLENLTPQALAVFDRLDPQHTGVVSTETLAKAVQDPAFTGQDAKALAAIYELKAMEVRAEKMRNQPGNNNLQPGIALDDPHVLTREEVSNLPNSVATEAAKRGLLQAINAPDLFPALDLNHDGRLSADELAKDPLYGPFAKTYGQLSEEMIKRDPNIADTDEIRKNGPNQEELKEVLREQLFKSNQADNLEFSLKHSNDSLGDLTHPELYADCADPLKSIKMDDVKQGASGDCYFDSALAAVAAKQPQVIRDSIRDNKDGTYTVTFKGDPLRPVTVTGPTDTELALYNRASSDGIWPNVMEKAFAAHEHLAGRQLPQENTDIESVSGGSTSYALSLLTGQYHGASEFMDTRREFDPNYHYSKRVDKAMLELRLSATFGGYALVGTRGGQATRDNQLLPNHAYTVVDYSPGPDGGSYELRNPWAEKKIPNGEYFSITAAQLAKSLDNVTVAPVGDQVVTQKPH